MQARDMTRNCMSYIHDDARIECRKHMGVRTSTADDTLIQSSNSV
jgi:hypothetical protein